MSISESRIDGWAQFLETTFRPGRSASGIVLLCGTEVVAAIFNNPTAFNAPMAFDAGWALCFAGVPQRESRSMDREDIEAMRKGLDERAVRGWRP